jgi:hypothetical protein
MFAEHYVADDLGRLIHVTGCWNHRLHAFKGSNHGSDHTVTTPQLRKLNIARFQVMVQFGAFFVALSFETRPRSG